MMKTKNGKIFKITEKLGAGQFGEVFKGIDLEKNSDVAIKVESVNSDHPQLIFEGKVYKYLNRDPITLTNGIPNVYYCATEEDFNIMVMDLLGPSLEDLFNLCGRKFSLKTVLMLADQMIQRIEYIHSRQFLHRDIKPDNFLIGKGNQTQQIYMIDFGLAKRYIMNDQQHIPYKDKKQFVGTFRYASFNNHIGIEQTRRDDLESLGYVLLYFLNGQLPWQNTKVVVIKEFRENSTQKKLSTTIETLCKNCPKEFANYLIYVKNLKFDEKPDYLFLRNMFKQLFIKTGLKMDNVYDWNCIQMNELSSHSIKQQVSSEQETISIIPK